MHQVQATTPSYSSVISFRLALLLFDMGKFPINE